MRSGHAIPSFAAFVRLCMNTASNVLGKVFLSKRVKHEKELTVLLSDKESSLKNAWPCITYFGSTKPVYISILKYCFSKLTSTWSFICYD